LKSSSCSIKKIHTKEQVV